MNEGERFSRLHRIARVFTPSAPTHRDSVFAGRVRERAHLRGAILEPGRHAMVYGARGVGKTSLANVVTNDLALESIPEPERRTSVRVPCGQRDDFDSLWRRALAEISVVPITSVETLVSPLAPGETRYESDAAGPLLERVDLLTTSEVERLLRYAERAIFVFDEFDVVSDPECRQEFAELIKAFSDSGSGPSIVLVGVGHDISELIESHASIERCLEQVDLPLLANDEIAELVRQGFTTLDLHITDGAVETIVSFSRGYPAFAHSLAKRAAEIAVNDDRLAVDGPDVVAGAFEAMEGLPFSLGESYAQAVEARHPNDQTETTLAACAWLGPGRFRPSQVLDVLRSWGKPVSMPTLMSQLRRLGTPDRGAILVQHGESRPSFEFRDPMLIPYVLIRTANVSPP